jgi:inner membrane protein
MATAFTHAFVAAALVPFAPQTVSRPKAALVLMSVAALPDLDVIAFPLGVPYGHPLGHRGVTHSLVFAAGVAFLLGWGLFRDLKPLSPAWARMVSLICLACASHGVLDACTDAGQGIGFFIPFSDQRFFFPWRPLLTSPVDPRTFFRPRGLQILLNEMQWVWLPVSSVWVSVVLLRRLRRTRSA